MREMILNHSSLGSPDRQTAIVWLRDVTQGMIQLTSYGVVGYILRSHRPLPETHCAPTFSLWDILLGMLQGGYREEYAFFGGLASKVPLIDDLDEDIKDRFLGCGSITLASPDGDPLVLAAIADWIIVGFPSEAIWDEDHLIVDFEEILQNGDTETASEKVENVARLIHAQRIYENHLERVRRGFQNFRSGADLWEIQGKAFPNLSFGLEVKAQLTRLNTGLLETVFNKLISLDESAALWRQQGGSAPPWVSKVTDESSSVKSNPALRDSRRFRSSDGSSHYYMWHARFGSMGRIHLRFDSASLEVEIGYIGWHLPL